MSKALSNAVANALAMRWGLPCPGFDHLKINRAIATRYDQLAEYFLSMVHLAGEIRPVPPPPL
ncbi:hypothetical protein GCM10007973_08370 [Polymorphobacter multimanifer]|nr:hypothetical protein GCM10007973_08370 [Polymorphobacter multimanifer]